LFKLQVHEKEKLLNVYGPSHDITEQPKMEITYGWPESYNWRSFYAITQESYNFLSRRPSTSFWSRV